MELSKVPTLALLSREITGLPPQYTPVLARIWSRTGTGPRDRRRRSNRRACTWVSCLHFDYFIIFKSFFSARLRPLNLRGKKMHFCWVEEKALLNFNLFVFLSFVYKYLFLYYSYSPYKNYFLKKEKISVERPWWSRPIQN